MKQIKLPSYPHELPSHVEVRDFDMEDGTFFRVVMELDTEVKVDHFHMTAQAFEMNADGTFAAAPLGYPSRSSTSTHTVIASAISDTQELDDAWVRHTGNIDPVALDLPRVTKRPSEPGKEYGELVWDTERSHAWRWQEGFADGTARAKLENIRAVLRTSNMRSGFGFRRN